MPTVTVERLNRPQAGLIHVKCSSLYPELTHKYLLIGSAGKDYRESVLKDASTSLSVVAGGDSDMRQALSDGDVKQVGLD